MSTKQTEALKLALEVMHNQGDVSVDEWIAAERAIREALAEQPAQQQEPVARVINKSIVWRPCDIAGLPVGTPLYTFPPASKPWVGLTDEERDEIYNTHEPYADLKTVEAKLREKNA